MKLKKILRSLMQVNAETADKIMKDYPAGCNADKVFDKSFKKYLSQKVCCLPMEPRRSTNPKAALRPLSKNGILTDFSKRAESYWRLRRTSEHSYLL